MKLANPKAALARDIKNILRKVDAGKPLAKHERDLLAVHAGEQPGEQWAANQVELAKALGVTRQSISTWLKTKGNPGRRPNGLYNVREWSAWTTGRNPDDSPDVKALRKEAVALQNAKLEHELAILRKEFVSVQQVEAWGGELGGAIKKVVTQLRKLAPQLSGLSVPEIEARLREAETEIMSQLHGLNTHIKEAKEAMKE